MKKTFSLISAFAILTSMSLNNYSSILKTNAASYRTTYKIYGDLNNDKTIDAFDVMSMRKEIVKGNYDKSLDLNCDNIIDSTDLTILNDYVLGKKTVFDAYFNDDADSDGICDIYEIKLFETDPDSKDSDGDKLSDYEEVIYTHTSPINKYTRELSITDADDDPDEDNLTNKEELVYKTNPQVNDTDSDGINDHDEIFVYKTDPLVADSDEDGITDGSEIKLGLDPKSPATNGVPDGERVIPQSIESDNSILYSVNTPSSPYELSIDIKTNGDAEKELTVDESSYSAVIENDAMIGASIDVKITDTCKPEEIVLKYNINDAYIDNTLNKYSSLDEFKGIKRLNVFRFNEEEGMLLPIETEFDIENNQLYAKADETGTYCIMDMEKWLDNLGVEMIDETSTSDIPAPKAAPEALSVTTSEWEQEYENVPIDLVFILGRYGDNENYFRSEKELILSFCRTLFIKYANIHVHVIGYGKRDANVYSYGKPYCTNYYELERVLDLVEYEKAPFGEVCNLNIPFSDLYYNTDLRDDSDTFIYLFACTMTQCTVGISEAEVINSSIGIYSHIHPMNVYIPDLEERKEFSDRIEAQGGFYKVFDESTLLPDMITHLEDHLSPARPVYDIFVPTKWKKISLKDKLIMNGSTNSDTDSLTDWEEVDKSKITIASDGNIEIPVFCMADLLEHLTRFNQNSEYNFLINDIRKIHYLPILSDPTDEDTDDDGMNDDKEDEIGSEKLSKNFFVQKSDYDYVQNYKNFEAPMISLLDDNYPLTSSFYSLSNLFLCGNGGDYELDKKAIIDFINTLKINNKLDQNKDMNELTQNVLDGIVEKLDAGIALLENKHFENHQKDIEALNDLKNTMLRRKSEINMKFYSEFMTRDYFYKRIDEAMAEYEKATQRYEVLSKKINVKDLRFKTIQNANTFLNYFTIVVDASFSAKETFQVYSDFFDSIRQYENTIEVLDIIINHSFDCDPSNVSAAASYLKKLCIQGYNESYMKWIEAINSGAGEVTSGAFGINVAKIPVYGQYIAGVLAVYSVISNIDDVAMYYEYTCAKDQITDTMVAEIKDLLHISKDEKYVYSSPEDYLKAKNLFYYLIMARTSAEQDCLNCLKAEPFYIERLGKACQEVSKNAINNLNTIIQKYFS